MKSSSVIPKKMRINNCKEDCELILIALYAYIGFLESHCCYLSQFGVVRITSGFKKNLLANLPNIVGRGSILKKACRHFFSLNLTPIMKSRTKNWYVE
jgi:hypothetical protein